MLELLEKSNFNFINSLHIKNFRNHEELELSSINSSVVILGNNGSGKTSILEAISTFSIGKGLRNSKFIEMVNKDSEQCLIKIGIKEDELINNELKSIFYKNKRLRKFYFNENEVRSFQSFRKSIHMLWLTPYTERIFTSSSSARRNFFDGIFLNFDNEHALRLTEYDKLLKQRNKILKEDYNDGDWLNVLEEKLSKLSVIISCSRLDILFKIQDMLKLPLKKFPTVEIKFSNSLENQLLKNSALDVEEELKNKYYESREIDKVVGGSQYGCQKSDLMVKNFSTNMHARMCSSGEQQAILVSLIIASSRALRKIINCSPILLLDEVFNHLDEIRREALLREIEELKSQAWITSAEKENFIISKKFCYHNLKN